MLRECKSEGQARTNDNGSDLGQLELRDGPQADGAVHGGRQQHLRGGVGADERRERQRRDAVLVAAQHRLGREVHHRPDADVVVVAGRRQVGVLHVHRHVRQVALQTRTRTRINQTDMAAECAHKRVTSWPFSVASKKPVSVDHTFTSLSSEPCMHTHTRE